MQGYQALCCLCPSLQVSPLPTVNVVCLTPATSSPLRSHHPMSMLSPSLCGFFQFVHPFLSVSFPIFTSKIPKVPLQWIYNSYNLVYFFLFHIDVSSENKSYTSRTYLKLALILTIWVFIWYRIMKQLFTLRNWMYTMEVIFENIFFIIMW